MAVFHIVRKDDPGVSIRLTRNRRSAEFLLSGFGEDYEIVEDICSEIKFSDRVDVFTEHGYNMSRQLRKDDAGFR